ncbi:Uncharacterized protein Adt_14752 [Abeliophyllum distichum]|uniref:Uncharacterized protein n=1 Tax=Abeliophyllum distichum TaxID=126358 RepID=A0ABD1U0J5_9LAMI
MRYLWHSTFWIKTERRGTEKRRKQRTKMDKENEKGEVQAAKEKQRVCKRCKETYSASSNTPTSCRYHPSFFVCRRHDDQIRYNSSRDLQLEIQFQLAPVTITNSEVLSKYLSFTLIEGKETLGRLVLS